VLPKPLMPIGDYPILEVIVRQLVHHGFTHITMAVSHQAEIIRAFFGNGASWGATIDYSLEDRPLSTIGPLRLIADLPERFLLMNGDVLTDRSFSEFFEEHEKSGARFTISAACRQHTIDYGVLRVNGSNRLEGFAEKPAMEYLVSMGVYALSRDILSLVPEHSPYGFDNLMRDLLERGECVSVSPYDGYWMDIGRPDDYMRAIDEFEQLKARLIPDA
jgi:NDP-sugar pyrophosphorylase family protein